MAIFFACFCNGVARTPKATHIKGKLLDQAVILSNCAPFQNENFSERKEFAPRGSEFFPLRAVPYGMENHFYNIGLPPLNVATYITHERKCVMGTTPMLLCCLLIFLFKIIGKSVRSTTSVTQIGYFFSEEESWSLYFN